MKHVTGTVLLGHTCLLVLALSTAAWAQNGRITGQVVADDTGAPLAGASVRVANLDRSTSTGSTSGVDGRYAIENLPPGSTSPRSKPVPWNSSRSTST